MTWITKWIRSLLYVEGMTPLPTKIMALLFLVMLSNTMAITMCLSYGPKMVKSFGVSEVDTGKYTGMIISSVYAGYIISSLAWGYLGDTKGNKLALIGSLSGMIITTLAFGFSATISWALITRLFQGCCMGFDVICKSILAKSLDSTNMSVGFSIYFTCWTISFILGPSIGGYLAFPADQYPETFSKDSIFGTFGVLLPNLVFVISNILVVICTIIFLPNDRKMTSKEKERLIAASDSSNYTEKTPVDKSNGTFNSKQVVKDETMNEEYTENCASIGVTSHGPTARCTPSIVTKVKQLLKSSDFVIAITSYALVGFAILGIEEMFPLFAATAYEYHGLNFETSQIGMVLLISSIFLLVTQLNVLPKVSNRFGKRKTFFGCALLNVFMVPMIPVVSAIRNSTLQTICVIAVMLTTQIGVNGSLVTLNILLNNAVPPDSYGSANGIGTAIASLGRIVSPIFFGSLYTWSLTNVKGVDGEKHALGFPFNQFFIFYLTSLSFFICALIVSAISPSLDK